MRISDWSSDVCSSDLTLDGGDGDDVIVVNAANTTVLGGAGSNTVSFGEAAGGVTINLLDGSGGDGSTFVNVHNVIGSGHGDIIIGGSTAGATLDGGGDDDTIVANAANTTVLEIGRAHV